MIFCTSIEHTIEMLFAALISFITYSSLGARGCARYPVPHSCVEQLYKPSHIRGLLLLRKEHEEMPVKH